MDLEDKGGFTEREDGINPIKEEQESNLKSQTIEAATFDEVRNSDDVLGKDTQKAEKDAEEGEKKMRLSPKQKKILSYIVFIVLNALVILVMILLEDRSASAVDGRVAFRRLGENWLFTLIAFLMFPTIVLCDTAVFGTLISKTGRKKNLALAMEVSILGRYYDRITPWSMGGEPFQIGYLIHGGLGTGDACSVTMSRHIIRFFTNAVVVITILAASRIATNIWVMIVAILSIFGGLIIPIFMLICAFRPSVGQKIGRGVISLLYKLKIVKDYDKQLAKLQAEIDKFLQGIKYLSSNKAIIVLIAVSAIVELFATNSAPYFVIRAMGVSDIKYWNTLVLCLFVSYCSSFAPTPGGAGIAELSFYAIFAAYIGDGVLFWAVLFWRIAIFYLPVFIGFILQTADSVHSMIKASKVK